MKFKKIESEDVEHMEDEDKLRIHSQQLDNIVSNLVLVTDSLINLRHQRGFFFTLFCLRPLSKSMKSNNLNGTFYLAAACK